MPNLYRQAVRLIKSAQEQASSQKQFYSDRQNRGMAVYPSGVFDFTDDLDTEEFPQLVSKGLQEEYSGGNDSIRSQNINSAWKDISTDDSQYEDQSDDNYNPQLASFGLDASHQGVQNLGNKSEDYTFSTKKPTGYSPSLDTINYNAKQLPDSTTDDVIRSLAHETAHRRSIPVLNVDTTSSNAVQTRTWLDWLKNTFTTLPWEGAYIHEWPSVVNEWTYGQPGGTIHPNMVRRYGKSRPLRGFTDKEYSTDTYLNDMFPLVDVKKLKSVPGTIYRYWRAPNEPNKPSKGRKRIVYDTPNGWWVNQFGRWERTGGDVFDPKYYFKNNMNIAQLPPNLQRHIHNMSFLNFGKQTPERLDAAEDARRELQDLLAPLALRRKFRNSRGKTYAQMIENTLDTIQKLKAESSIKGDSENDIIKRYFEVLGKFATPAMQKRVGVDLIGIKNFAPALVSDAIEYNPVWDPNMTLEPIPIGLAGLQKKYSITPTLDEPSDWRDEKQYKAMIRDAQHCYDLQNEINQYGPKDGGWGA